MAGRGRTKAVETKSWENLAAEGLAEAKEACCYLEEAFVEGPEMFLLALNRVVNARGGVGKLAKKTELSRESLYKLLSGERGARLSSVATILAALDIRVGFNIGEPKQKTRKKTGRKKLIGEKAA